MLKKGSVCGERPLALDYMDGLDERRSPRPGRKHKPKVQKPKQDPDAWVQNIALPALYDKGSSLPVTLENIEKLQIGQRVPRLTSPRWGAVRAESSWTHSLKGLKFQPLSLYS